jgi:hypothetical protein
MGWLHMCMHMAMASAVVEVKFIGRSIAGAGELSFAKF